MKYMLIMRANDEGYAAYDELDFTEIIAAMGAYNESLMKAGVLLAGEGLTDAAEGFVVDFDSTPPVVTDGPYAEAKELFNGFWIIQVSSKEEAAEWAKRCPLGPGTRLEVRRVTELEDFPQDNEWIQKEAGWREELEGKAAGTNS
ncbi:YciI family protein [Agromyces sp. SYSU K20354]|uniref:YciI family protein n=1 Tax=Agromyces cavernae TaxID=2898659 RepID=UPI001E58344F|nr:YciI family protein [Agromyces cavernae]MCD2441279.1 YciI family protein [Agromyces cavernae]